MAFRVVDSGNIALRQVRRIEVDTATPAPMGRIEAGGSGHPTMMGRPAGGFPGMVHTPRKDRHFAAPILMVHSPHQRCGVGEYGRALDAAFGRAQVPLDAVTLGDEDYIVQAARSGMGMLVHYEPGIAPPGLAPVLREARGRGARIVLCCHLWDSGIFDWGVAHALILHRPYSGAGGTIIPLGCPVYTPSAEKRREVRARMGWGDGDVVLMTAGLLASWKRIPEMAVKLCQAVLAHGQQGNMRLHFQVPPPFGGDGGESGYLRQFLANFPAVRSHVSTDFVPAEDLLDVIAAADLGFTYHGKDTGSVSAATKQFVAARTPIVVTHSTHASDLERGLRRSDADAANFAAECVRTASDPNVLRDLRAEMDHEYGRMNMDVVAKRYMEVFRALGVGGMPS